MSGKHARATIRDTYVSEEDTLERRGSQFEKKCIEDVSFVDFDMMVCGRGRMRW